MSSKKGKRQSVRISPWMWIVLLLMVVVAVVGNYFVNFHGPLSDQADDWGQFGDYVGGVLNPLLSFCAFAGLLVTLRAQNAESLNADLRHRSQVFDGRIFQMLTLINDVTHHLKLTVGDESLSEDEREVYEGRRAVIFAAGMLMMRLRRIDRAPARPELVRLVQSKFSSWRNSYWNSLYSYIEGVVVVLEYAISESESDKQLDFALGVVSSQLSLDERTLFFYVLANDLSRYEVFSRLVRKGFFHGTVGDPLYKVRDALFEQITINHSMRIS